MDVAQQVNVPHFSQANHFEAKLSSLIGQPLWN
jgi:hypothetical protein